MAVKSVRGSSAAILLVLASSCANPASPGPGPLAPGSWGGSHASLTVTAGGGHIEFDCAHGDVTAPIVVDRGGSFTTDGVFVQEHGGPIRVDEELAKRPARYSGRISGDSLSLDVTLTDTQEKRGTFELTRNGSPRVTKCL